MSAHPTRLRVPRLSRRRDERGAVAVLTAVFFAALFFAISAIAVDVSRWYMEIERVQKAADAGALAGVTHMPQDIDSARTVATAVSGRNGYPDSGTTRVTVAQGRLPSQIRVTVSSEVDNTFGSFFGFPTTTIRRAAVADYNGPQPMGSPCNTYGNEPPGTDLAGPVGSQLAVPAGATCPRTPQFWFTAHGPEVHKTQGDQYGTRVCNGAESGCTGTTNNEFRPEGYFMLVRVPPAAVGQSLTIQLYDPAYVATASRCNNWDTATVLPIFDDWNPWTRTDGRLRYARNSNFVTVGSDSVAFCTGDDPNSGLRRGPATPTVTSFALRQPVDSLHPPSAPAQPGCTKQFPGYGAPLINNLLRGLPFYNPNLARVFHQWVPLCTFIPSQAGDYYLQVRTNVALGGAVNDPCDATATPAPCTGAYVPPNAATSAVVTQAADDASVLGNGSNRFAVRAISSAAGQLSVAAYGRMPIFANSDSAAPTFNLIRILPGAAGKTLVFTFYDVGDAATGGTMTVLRPTDATGAGIANCSATGFFTGALPTCSLGGITGSAGWNGQSETISVPIPSDYSCNYLSSGGCWWRVRVSFGTGSVTDATTWTASVTGDPVRLVE